MVMTHAVITFPATPHRTELARRATPAPMIEPVIVCVVETGMPSVEAVNTTIDQAIEALNPWCCDSLVMRLYMVSMIFHPPIIVPSPMAM